MVSYVSHEGDMARMERTIQRQWITIIILIVTMAVMFVGFFIYESQFEDVCTTTEGVSQYIDADGTAVVAGIGDAMYGYEGQTNG